MIEDDAAQIAHDSAGIQSAAEHHAPAEPRLHAEADEIGLGKKQLQTDILLSTSSRHDMITRVYIIEPQPLSIDPRDMMRCSSRTSTGFTELRRPKPVQLLR